MNRKRVLVTPLDWGLGHATRCIPIIRILLKHDCEVFLGGSGYSLTLLQNEFPTLHSVELPPYNPVYSSSGSMAWAMFTQLFKFMNVIKKEHNVIEQHVLSNQINYVLSDNRYGCWSTQAISVFITHQTNIIPPTGLRWMSRIVNYFNRRQIRKFDQCWIPDFPDHTFSGILSESSSVNERFIGPLSRFSKSSLPEKKYDLLVLLSGPEPQRSILEELLVRQLSLIQGNILFVRGVKTGLNEKLSNKFTMVDFLSTGELQVILEQAELVISRSGYSTIMDLARLGKKAIFIPTPGQPEQEYLAEHLKEKKIAYFETQLMFDLQRALHESEKYSGFEEFDQDDSLLLIPALTALSIF